jgi:hypothetical protein
MKRMKFHTKWNKRTNSVCPFFDICKQILHETCPVISRRNVCQSKEKLACNLTFI